MSRQPHTYRPEDLDGWPMVTTDDWRALFWLLAFAGIFIALCSVGS